MGEGLGETQVIVDCGSLGFEVLDGVGGQGNLETDIEEDADHGQHRVPVGPDAASAYCWAILRRPEIARPGDGRQMCAHDDEAQREQGDGDGDIRALDGVRYGCLCGHFSGIGEDEYADHDRGHGRAQRIKGLCQSEPRRGALLGAENGDVRIGRGLQPANARGEHETGGEEEGKTDQAGRGDKEQGAHHHHEQRNHHGALVAYGLNDLGGGN